MEGLWILEDYLTGATTRTWDSKIGDSVEIRSMESAWFKTSVRWTKLGKSSGGISISKSVIGGENSAEALGILDDWSGIEVWGGKVEWEEEGVVTYLEIQDLKGKTNSLKTTSLDKKQVLVLKSYNLYPLTPCG